jgi:hypothetical protein
VKKSRAKIPCACDRRNSAHPGPSRRGAGSIPEQRQPRPVRPRQPGMRLRPLTLGDSELMAQHQDLGVLPPRLPALQPEQRHGTGHDQEDQLQAHKAKIIPPPAEPRPAQPTPSRLTEPTATLGHLPKWHRVFGIHKRTSR